MQCGRGSFWVHKTDLERLFGAAHLCYLIGTQESAGDHSKVVGLAADLQRARGMTGAILLVPVVAWLPREARELDQPEPSVLSRDVCRLFYLPPDGLDGGGPRAHQPDHLAEVRNPPPSYSQILALGEPLFDELKARPLLAMIEALNDWLQTGINDGDTAPPLAILGGPLPDEEPWAEASARAAALLARAVRVEIRDGSVDAVDASEAYSDLAFSSDEATATSTNVTTPLSDWLVSGHLTSLAARYENTVQQLAETLGQLSDLQFAYEGLINLNERFKRLQAHKARLKQELGRAQQELGRAHAEVQRMQATKLWRLAVRYWRTRDRINRLLGRRSLGLNREPGDSS